MVKRYLPPEWAPQSGVMLTWPHSHSDWKAILSEVDKVYCELATQISRREKVLIVAYDEQHRQHIEYLLQHTQTVAQNLRIIIIKSNDTWARDHGPITIIEDGQPVLLDFTFNGWGGKYAADLDNQLTRSLQQQGAFHSLNVEVIDMVLEGGSIDVNSQGLLLTTSSCLLTDTRNPGLSREQIESTLKSNFGVHTLLWLDHGHLVGDDTDSHIDTLARFCNDSTIAYTVTTDHNDEHFEGLQKMEQQLNTLTQSLPQPIKLVALPLPPAQYKKNGMRLPATYANFLIINGAVLVPTYRCSTDTEALTILQTCFPERGIIGIDCLPLINQFGSLHCVTMQFPVGVLV